MTVKFMRRDEAAKYIREHLGLPCEKSTLAKFAVTGGGPAYQKFGRFPMYDPAELERWSTARLGPKRGA